MAGTSLSRAYQWLVLAYLVSLLFVYPYGVPLGADASVRAPDLLGVLCLLAGALVLTLRGRLRIDPLFLWIAGPFVVLELVTPVIGAVGYRAFGDAVSSVRMAILWLPMIFLTMLSGFAEEPRFERRLRALLQASIWLNLAYALVQIAVDLGFAPDWAAFTRALEPWAVDRSYEVNLGLRPSGFFVNTTALSVFGVVCLSYFYAHYVASRGPSDLRYVLLSLVLVVLTTSRVAFVASALIIAAGWFGLTRGRKAILAAILLAGMGALLAAIEYTIGLEDMFFRFTRLVENGLLADFSFGRRFRETWPAALAVAENYPVGTMISAPRIAVLIDSGYLTYYVQGRWMFIAGIAALLAGMAAIGLRSLHRSGRNAGGLMILFMFIYLALALVVSNPTRSPLVIAFLVFAFYRLRTERLGRWVAGRPQVLAGT